MLLTIIGPKPNRDGEEMGSQLAGREIFQFATGISTWKDLRASRAMPATPKFPSSAGVKR